MVGMKWLGYKLQGYFNMCYSGKGHVIAFEGILTRGIFPALKEIPSFPIPLESTRENGVWMTWLFHCYEMRNVWMRGNALRPHKQTKSFIGYKEKLPFYKTF